MKDKKGFTLVELLAVIAILAVLVIIALPNVLKLFRNAKANTFANEVQNLVRSAEDKFVTGSILSGNNTCFDSKTNPLDMSGRNNINYLIKLTNKGKVIEVKVIDDSYQLLIDNEDGINKADIGNKYQVEARNKTTDILDCNNSFLVQGENGTGDESTPYKIQYIEDLVELSKNVESGQTYEGKTIVLSRNLDFKNKDSYKDKNNSELYNQLTTGNGFTPIGLNGTFSGTLDGKNHRIDNLYINRTEISSGVAALISNLVNGNVKNLIVQGKVETTAINNSLGGIVGKIQNSTMDNCINEVVVTSKTGTYGVGGLVSFSTGDATIKNSINKANITGGGQTSGIIAVNQGGTLTIENCKNYGTITNELSNVTAGIVGDNTYLDATKTIIKNSANYGDIISTNISNTALYLGGLVGKSTKELEITNSSNEGNITNGNINNITIAVGGLVGHISNTDTNVNKIINSYNKGKIDGGNRTGGIIGLVDNKSIVLVDKCYNLGSVKNTFGNQIAHSFSSGIIGYEVSTADGVIINSYNKGEIISDKWGMGIALNEGSSKLQIINSYNVGNINGSSWSLGISRIWKDSAGHQFTNNVYNYGKLNGTNKFEILSTSGPTEIISVNNAYYVDRGNLASDIEINATSLTENQLLNKDMYNSKLFVDILNDNVKNIKLSDINSSIGNLTLCNWKKSTVGYPELDCK